MIHWLLCTLYTCQHKYNFKYKQLKYHNERKTTLQNNFQKNSKQRFDTFKFTINVTYNNPNTPRLILASIESNDSNSPAGAAEESPLIFDVMMD